MLQSIKYVIALSKKITYLNLRIIYCLKKANHHQSLQQIITLLRVEGPASMLVAADG